MGLGVGRTRQSGFTLIELIISIMLMAIVSGILATIIAVNFDVMAQVSDRKKLVTRGMLAINLFQRELGMLTDSTSFVTADDQELEFMDKYGNTWNYAISGSDITRQEVGVGSAQILASPLLNASSGFSYYAGNNAVLASTPLSAADRKLIRLVELKLVMDDGESGIPLLAVVYPENMKVYNR